jgi:hypothetical protein
VWSDSCGGTAPGYGLFLGGFAVAGTWPAQVVARARGPSGRVDNNVLEAQIAAIGVVVAARLLPGAIGDTAMHLLGILDSAAAEGAARVDSTRNGEVNRIMRVLGEIARRCGFNHRRTPPRRVLTDDCTFADALSRISVYRKRFYAEVAAAQAEAMAAGLVQAGDCSVEDGIVFLTLPPALIDFTDVDAICACVLDVPRYPHPASAAWYRLLPSQVPTMPAGGPFLRPRTARAKQKTSSTSQGGTTGRDGDSPRDRHFEAMFP